MAVLMIIIASCKDDSEVSGPPVINEVRNYAASPDDTLIQTLNTGQWVVLLGKNFSPQSQIYFNSVPASVNNTLFTHTSMVVQVPDIPFQSVPANDFNEVTVVNEKGATTFTIEILGEPIISYVRNYADAPNDSLLNAVVPGQKINIIGYNLKNATEIAFQGIGADLAGVVYSDTSVVVTIPEDLSGADATLANMISVTTALGTGTFSIKIIGPPSITSVSNEVPQEGDSVYLYGNNFTSIQSITFAGIEISEYKVSGDEKTIGFIAPALTQSGPVEITTAGGSFASAYNVNDVATGALSNFEWDGTFKWDWWGGANLAVEDASLNEGWIPDYPEFNGNSSKFLVLDLPVQSSGGGADWSTAIRMTGGNAPTWFPSADNLGDPAGSWALKFEINISDDWNGGTLVIKTNNSDYIARYEPWQVSESKTTPYKTSGWQTVSIPFTSFRKNDSALGEGKGDPITKISDLFNMGSEVGDFLLYLHNYDAGDTKTGFKAAFDNFRVVKR